MKAKKFSFHAGLLCMAALFVTLLLLLSSCGEDDKKPTETVDDKNFTYAVENGQATVASYTPSGEISPALNIPSTLGGYPVVRIGEGAFSGLKNIKEIVLPDSVTDIGKEAFKDCSDLTNITIPDSVTNIGQVAFSGCAGLTSITIPDSVTNIGDSAFWGCTGLTSITIPNSVTSIGAGAFSGCAGLTSITVDSKNKVYHASNNCLIETATKTLVTGCKTSVIPTDGRVTSIGSRAFSGCSGLTSITIPDSVTSIGGSAFYGCTSLKIIYYTGTAAQWTKISKGSGAIPDGVRIVYNYKPTA